MRGEVRFHWRHGIVFRKTDVVDGVPIRRGLRVSVTFRKLTDRMCECNDLDCCDVANPGGMQKPRLREFDCDVANPGGVQKPRLREFD